MGATTAIAGGLGVQGLANLFGAQSQSNANNQNLAYAVSHQNLLQNYVNQMMQPGVNPYSQAMLNFVGQGLPSGIGGFTPPGYTPLPGAGSGGGVTGGTGNNGGDGTGGTPTPTDGSGGSQINPNADMAPGGGDAGYVSSIFANDPGRPGAGYVIVNGVPRRIEGTTAAGQNRAPTAQDQYILDDGTLGPSVNVKDYTAWTNATYGPNTAPGTQASNPGGGPADYLVGGQHYTDYNQALAAYNQQLAAGNIPPVGQVPNFGPGSNGGSPYGGGQGSGMMTPQFFGNPTYNPATLGQAPLVAGQQIGGLPQLNAQMVTPGSSQALNTGQDALMQMLRSNLNPSQDPTLSLNLQQLGSGADQYNLNPLFNSIETQGQNLLDQQISQMRGAAGSLGQRFGTAEQQNEGLMRTNYAANTNAQEQQIGLQAFQNAQALRQPALNLMGQLGTTNQSNQLQAATSLAGLGQQTNQLNLNALLANQGANLQAQQGNLNAALGVGTANQSNSLQAALANQGLLGQFLTNNANVMNQAGQFNAQMGFNTNQLNANQGNTYNNLVLQALNQAGNLQNSQSSYNAGLLGILNSVGVPQAQASPWASAIGNLGSTAAMIPFLNQAFNQGNQSNSLGFARQAAGSINPSTFGYGLF